MKPLADATRSTVERLVDRAMRLGREHSRHQKAYKTGKCIFGCEQARQATVEELVAMLALPVLATDAERATLSAWAA